MSRLYPRWPVVLLAGSAFVAIWGGGVELGRMSGFGPVRLLPGIADITVDLAITLPLGMEVYAAYAMGAWLTRRPIPDSARAFAKWSALVALVVGAAGQIAYHLLAAAGITVAPWQVVVIVSCVPVAVLGMASQLAHRLASAAPEAADPVDVEPAEQDEELPLVQLDVENPPLPPDELKEPAPGLVPVDVVEKPSPKSQPAPPTSAPPNKLSELEEARIRGLAEAGRSERQIAAETGRSRGAIRRVLHESRAA